MEIKKLHQITSLANLASLNQGAQTEHYIQAWMQQLQHQQQQQLPHHNHHQNQQQQHQHQHQQQQQRQQQAQQQLQIQHQNHLQHSQLQLQAYHNNIKSNNNINNNINHHQLNQLQPSSRNSIIIENGNRHANSNSNITNNHPHTPKKELIDLVTCKLCKGYLVDAATLDLCMHSFCRPCAVKFIREKPRCPECNLAIKDKRILNRLKTDVTMQNIVYKLVPGLYEKEMARRRKFYEARPVQPPRYKSEMFGDIPPSKTIKSDDMLNVCITWSRECLEEEPIKTYLHCRADSTMLVLKKLIIAKFGLDKPIKIYYGNSEIFFDLTTLMDVASTFNWAPESKILNLSFNEEEEEEKILINSLHLTSSDHGP